MKEAQLSLWMDDTGKSYRCMKIFVPFCSTSSLHSLSHSLDWERLKAQTQRRGRKSTVAFRMNMIARFYSL